MKKQIKIWMECARLRTLPVSLSGVVMAVALAVSVGVFRWKPAVLCLLFALLAQVVSNMANEYYDYLRGADKVGRVGPRRGVTEGDIRPETLRLVTLILLVLTGITGCCLIPYGGWWLVPVGLVIVVAAIAYSAGPYPLSYHGLGELAVFIFFGVVPVNFTFYLQSGRWDGLVLLASMTVGLQAVNVLLVNNYRDVMDDREAGKRTSVVIWGQRPAAAAYLINGYVSVALLSPLWVLASIGARVTPWVLLVPLLYLGLHTASWWQLLHRTGAELNPLLGGTARNMLLFTALMAIFLIAF